MEAIGAIGILILIITFIILAVLTVLMPYFIYKIYTEIKIINQNSNLIAEQLENVQKILLSKSIRS